MLDALVYDRGRQRLLAPALVAWLPRPHEACDHRVGPSPGASLEGRAELFFELPASSRSNLSTRPPNAWIWRSIHTKTPTTTPRPASQTAPASATGNRRKETS